MKYRKFGKLRWDVSVLGFGIMRLPVINNDTANIDETKATRMVRYAIDHGVNYLDMGYPYHEGNSEKFIGKVLKDGYREKVKVATKMPTWLIESTEDFDRYLNEQLDRLQLEEIDFYLLHDANSKRWPKLQELGVLKWAEDTMKQGKIKHLGFSFHDDYEVFKGIVDSYDNWTLSQIQYNYMDVDYQAGRRGLEYAANKGLAVVVMEPLRGGLITKKVPIPVANIWNTIPQKRTAAEIGLQWVWNHREVSVALSGMSTMKQVKENIATADNSAPCRLSAEELAVIEKVRETYSSLSPIPCTGCKYCMPCPNGVEIPLIFQTYNEAKMYNDLKTARFRYHHPNILREDQRADQCKECNECLEACPQNIPIPKWLNKAHRLLD